MNKVYQTKRVIRFRRFCRKAYAAFTSLHREVSVGRVAGYMTDLEMLKQGGAIDRSLDVRPFKAEVTKDYEENLKTHYRSDIEQSYDPEDVCNDSVFFIPVIDKIFELTKIV